MPRRSTLRCLARLFLFAATLALQSSLLLADEPILSPPSSAARQDASSPSIADADPDRYLERALVLERERMWSAAIEVYQAASDRWPGRADFRHRLRLCESHYRLGRRYQDESFRSVLLRLSLSSSLDLYDEILERIEEHYVDPVSLVPLVRRGYDNLEVALRDPYFLDANAPRASADRVLWLRKELQKRRNALAVAHRAEARAHLVECYELGRRALGLAPACVALEFVFAASDALDDYSSYLTPDKLDDLYAVIDGNFVGLGVELKGDPLGLLLVGVIPGGPAAQAGVKTGERITKVGDTTLAGKRLDEAASRLQGPEGTVVEIELLDVRRSASRRVRLVRRPVEVKSVTQSRIVDPLTGIGYVQLSGFQKSSTEELHGAIAALQRQGLSFLVLDLRGNPGGLLDVAVEIADEFLDDGVIVTTRGRAGNQSATYRAQPGVSWRMPLALLVDHDSASASEILAGALKDNRRAMVVGEQSYGKGSVQSIFPLRAAPAGLKLTTAKFYSPLDRSYSEHGVEPDVAIRIAKRPVGDEPGLALIEPGNPERDPALESAMHQAKRLMSVAR